MLLGWANFSVLPSVLCLTANQVWAELSDGSLIKGIKIGRFNFKMTQQSSIQILMLCSVVPASQAAQCCFSKRKQLKLERLNAAVSHHRTCWDTLVCLKPSSNCSVSQVCWPILSNNMVASARHVALAVDVSVSHVSTGRAMKRVSRQRNLSTPDTPSVVWLYRADGFDWGQTGRRGGIHLLSALWFC